MIQFAIAAGRAVTSEVIRKQQGVENDSSADRFVNPECHNCDTCRHRCRACAEHPRSQFQLRTMRMHDPVSGDIPRRSPTGRESFDHLLLDGTQLDTLAAIAERAQDHLPCIPQPDATTLTG